VCSFQEKLSALEDLDQTKDSPAADQNPRANSVSASLTTDDAVEKLKHEFRNCESLDTMSVLFHKYGICHKSLVTKRAVTAGTILDRSAKHVQQFRERMNINLCVYKVGMTTNPLVRWHSYKQDGYDLMSLLHVSASKGLIDMLEAALIREHMGNTGCRNIRLGGDGPSSRKRDCEASALTHFVCYVVGSRADQHSRIG
jgi:hypothetical protein